MADVFEESSGDSSDSTSSDNFIIYTETSSSEEDLQNVEEPGTSTSSATTHNFTEREMEIIIETADCEKVQATTVIFRGKSLSKNKLTCKNAVARIYGSCTLRVMGSWGGSVIFVPKGRGGSCVFYQPHF